ncbi:MAG: hypothetical protein ABIR87_03600 [Sphingomicrobium sp.]
MRQRRSPTPPPPIEEGVPYTPVYDADENDQLGYQASPTNFSHPHWIEEDRTLLPVLYTADGDPVIAFDPVPQQRKRRIGWDGPRQRAFVASLARNPSIGFAARAVGMSPQSFYRLIERPGAESFAKAVDLAIDHGLARLRASGGRRGLSEDAVPVFRRGRHVRTELRRNDRLAIAILRQASADPERLRHAVQLRWRRKQEWASLDAGRAALAAEQAAADARYQAELEACINTAAPLRLGPRILPL